MPKCEQCGNRFRVRDTTEYFLVKDKRGKQYRFDSAKCLSDWIKERLK